jgi:hypothetical protein
MKPDRNAVVAVTHGDTTDNRPALFVFMCPDGFAWIEPAYLEDQPPRQCFVRVAGSLLAGPGGFSVIGADGRHYDVAPLDSFPDAHDDLKRVCAWATAELAAKGMTLDAEREGIRQHLGDQLT